MKKLYFLPLLFLALTTLAQKQFVVQNGTAQTFETLAEAYNAASAGDTIYLPGGGFPSLGTVEKSLHWRGVGHYPDSTIATGHTQINGAITFNTDCDGSTFEGIFFDNNVQFGNVTNQEVTDVTMKRCRIGGTLTLRKDANLDNGYPLLNFHLSESVTKRLDANFGQGCIIEKNLIFEYIYEFRQSLFANNTINSYNKYYQEVYDCTYCLFKNNVFGSQNHITGCDNSHFKNNLFAGALPYNTSTSSITGENNIYSIGSANMFKTISGNVYDFSYSNDYHLNTTSTGTAEDGTTGVSITGTASDGTNAGIYGSSLPYKEGAVPYYPHIQTADINDEAVGGNLGVQIKVAAQER